MTWAGPARVGGLSMTRAIGCYHLRSQGVVATPDITEYIIDPANDAALVIATGVQYTLLFCVVWIYVRAHSH